jgi:hypothetical protein
MRSRSALLVLAAASLVATACASAGRTREDAARVRPPTLLASPRPEWRYPSPPREGRVLDLRVEVQVDSAGQPDLETLRVTGLGAAENREAVVTWVRNARFRPAEQAGRPVPGLFQTRFAVRAAVRRIS